MHSLWLVSQSTAQATVLLSERIQRLCFTHRWFQDAPRSPGLGPICSSILILQYLPAHTSHRGDRNLFLVSLPTACPITTPIYPSLSYLHTTASSKPSDSVLGSSLWEIFSNLPGKPKCHGSVCFHSNQIKGYQKSGQTLAINTKALCLCNEEKNVQENHPYNLLGGYAFNLLQEILWKDKITSFLIYGEGEKFQKTSISPLKCSLRNCEP